MSLPLRERRPSRRSEHTSCPLCGGAAHVVLRARDLNRGTVGDRFSYLRCDACGAYSLADPPADLSPFYPPEYFELPDVSRLDELARSQRPVVESLLAHTSVGRLVEVGPGEGVFARAARNAGFAVTVVEMDARACEYLSSVAGVQAIRSAEPEQALAALPQSRAIVMWQVIEHLRRPWDVIEQVAANLEPGGALALSTPNPSALQFRLLRGRWAHLDAPRHLFLIPLQTLARRCSSLGLHLVSSTTTDAGGLHWNRFGWEYALRNAPRSRSTSRARQLSARAIAQAASAIERRGMLGCSYTAIFVKRREP